MKSMELGRLMSELREKKGMSMRDMEKKCGLSFTTVCKIERGRSCRWESVHVLLTRGLGVRVDSNDYHYAKEMWMRHREAVVSSMPTGWMKQKLGDPAAQFVKAAREAVRDMREDEIKSMHKALLREKARLAAKRI